MLECVTKWLIACPSERIGIGDGRCFAIKGKDFELEVMKGNQGETKRECAMGLYMCEKVG
jgi:hypothetical protein